MPIFPPSLTISCPRSSHAEKFWRSIPRRAARETSSRDATSWSGTSPSAGAWSPSARTHTASTASLRDGRKSSPPCRKSALKASPSPTAERTSSSPSTSAPLQSFARCRLFIGGRLRSPLHERHNRRPAPNGAGRLLLSRQQYRCGFFPSRIRGGFFDRADYKPCGGFPARESRRMTLFIG